MPTQSQIFLQFGLDIQSLKRAGDQDNAQYAEHLVWIGDSARGGSDLVCPYCRTSLIAKKGLRKQHHFAHAQTTCRDVLAGTAAGIPLYDELATLPGLWAGDLKFLSQLLRHRQISRAKFRGNARVIFDRLIDETLLEEVPAGQRWVNNIGSHVYTTLGKQYALAGKNRLALAKFDVLQQDAMLRRLRYLNILAPMGGSSFVDLQLYQSHLSKLLSQQLYFLKIDVKQANSRRLYKIGVTYRAIDERLSEIRNELREHVGEVGIQVVGLWPNKGRLELYFKHTFHRYQQRIGSLTEYFDFEKGGKQVQRPFREFKQLNAVALHEALAAL